MTKATSKPMTIPSRNVPRPGEPPGRPHSHLFSLATARQQLPPCPRARRPTASGARDEAARAGRIAAWGEKGAEPASSR